MPQGGNSYSAAVQLPLLRDELYVEEQAQYREVERRLETMTRAEFLAGGAVVMCSLLGSAWQSWLTQARAERHTLLSAIARFEQPTQKRTAAETRERLAA